MKCIRRTVFVVPEDEVGTLGRLQATLSWLDEGGSLTESSIDRIRQGLTMIRRMKATEVYEPVTAPVDIDVEVASA